jgi:hypothetical protein
MIKNMCFRKVLWPVGKIILRLVKEAGQEFGPVKALVNFHKNCIFELVPKSSQLIIGLVLSRSTHVNLTSKIFDYFEGNEGDRTGYNNIFTP